jgi:hypothetical protein
MSPMGRGLSHWWRTLVTGGLMGWKGFEGTPYPFVMPGLDPGIHVSPPERKTWMAGSSPAMTDNLHHRLHTRQRVDVVAEGGAADLEIAVLVK